MNRALMFILGAVRDPVSRDLSSTRLAGLTCVGSGLVFAFLHPSESASIAALLGGGGFAFLNRAKSEASGG